MISIVPLPQPMPVNLTIQAELDNVTFTFTFFYNQRDGGWYLTISDPANNVILASQRVVVDYPIGWKQRAYNPAMPPGIIQFLDTTGQGLDPALADLGARVQMTYFDLAEVQSQLAGGPTNVPG